MPCQTKAPGRAGNQFARLDPRGRSATRLRFSIPRPPRVKALVFNCLLSLIGYSRGSATAALLTSDANFFAKRSRRTLRPRHGTLPRVARSADAGWRRRRPGTAPPSRSGRHRRPRPGPGSPTTTQQKAGLGTPSTPQPGRQRGDHDTPQTKPEIDPVQPEIVDQQLGGRRHDLPAAPSRTGERR